MGEHNDHCLDLMYGYHDAEGAFHPPVATVANDFEPHVVYHAVRDNEHATPPDV